VSLSHFAAGLGLGLSLIVAIGAQNAFLLRQGLRREHVLPVVIVCAASDVTLYVVGAAGFGALAANVPWLIDVVRWVGAAFLIGYGLLAARRAIASSGAALSTAADGEGSSSPHGGRVALAPATRTRSVVLTALALTWLNPHVYLDTVFLAGSVAAAHGDGRWTFVLGASVASIAWFTALGYGTRGLGRWLSSPRAWRLLDGVIAATMVVIGVSLVVS
jgi:L-lysine exporter family protein LysE/ArgO